MHFNIKKKTLFLSKLKREYCYNDSIMNIYGIKMQQSSALFLQEQNYTQHKLDIIDKYMLLTFSDLEGNITDASQAFLDFTGYTREDIIGKNHSIFKHADVADDYIKKMWRVLLKDKTFRGELKNINKKGVYFWIKIIIEPIFDKENNKVGYLAIREDISSQKSLEELSIKDPLTQCYNRAHFSDIFRKEFAKAQQRDHSVGLLLIDIDFFKLYNKTYSHQDGDDALVKIASSINAIASTEKLKLFRLAGGEFTLITNAYTDEALQELAHKIIKTVRDLAILHEESKISDFLTVSIGAVNLQQLEDISINDLFNTADQNLYVAKRKGRNTLQFTTNIDRISFENEVDEITHLPTRVKLNEDLGKIKENAMVILLHINDFNFFSEQYGISFIQKMLVKQAKELRSILLDTHGTVYRLNINEFAILVRDEKQFERYLSLVKFSVLAHNKCEFKEEDGKEIVVTFTAGISYGVHQLLRKANMALQDAFKSMSSYAIYEEDENVLLYHKNRLHNLSIYQEALQNDKIIPYFQPLVDTKTQKVVKYEALARIEKEDGEIITPNFFLDVAKEDKTFEYFTRQLFQKVFNIYAKNDIELSLNVTYENIISQEFLGYLENRLIKYGGEKLTFELIESEEILDYKAVSNFITFVKRYGCKVAIDDFGSGYSNFTNLVKLEIDYIKIDGSIIQKLSTDPNVMVMTKSLINFAKETNIKTIAEFVSSKEIVKQVKALDIDLLQGYYYGAPQPPSYYGLITS